MLGDGRYVLRCVRCFGVRCSGVSCSGVWCSGDKSSGDTCQDGERLRDVLNCILLDRTGISFREGVLLEPLGVAHNGVETIQVKGHDVLVLGAGPIGDYKIKC